MSGSCSARKSRRSARRRRDSPARRRRPPRGDPARSPSVAADAFDVTSGRLRCWLGRLLRGQGHAAEARGLRRHRPAPARLQRRGRHLRSRSLARSSPNCPTSNSVACATSSTAPGRRSRWPVPPPPAPEPSTSPRTFRCRLARGGLNPQPLPPRRRKPGAIRGFNPQPDPPALCACGRDWLLPACLSLAARAPGVRTRGHRPRRPAAADPVLALSAARPQDEDRHRHDRRMRALPRGDLAIDHQLRPARPLLRRPPAPVWPPSGSRSTSHAGGLPHLLELRVWHRGHARHPHPLAHACPPCPPIVAPNNWVLFMAIGNTSVWRIHGANDDHQGRRAGHDPAQHGLLDDTSRGAVRCVPASSSTTRCGPTWGEATTAFPKRPTEPDTEWRPSTEAVNRHYTHEVARRSDPRTVPAGARTVGTSPHLYEIPPALPPAGQWSIPNAVLDTQSAVIPTTAVAPGTASMRSGNPAGLGPGGSVADQGRALRRRRQSGGSGGARHHVARAGAPT